MDHLPFALPVMFAEVELLPPDWKTAMWVCLQLVPAVLLIRVGRARNRSGLDNILEFRAFGSLY